MNLSLFSSSCGGISSLTNTSTTLIHDTTVRSLSLPSSLLTITHTNTNIGGVPLSGYTSGNVIMFGAPNTGTGNMGRLIFTKVLCTSHSVINNVS